MVLFERVRACPMNAVSAFGITQMRTKLAPALRVVTQQCPLGVAPRSFRATKSRSPRLNSALLGNNRGYSMRINRPQLGHQVLSGRFVELRSIEPVCKTLSRAIFHLLINITGKGGNRASDNRKVIHIASGDEIRNGVCR